MVFGNELLSTLPHGLSFFRTGSHELNQAVGDLLRFAGSDAHSGLGLLHRVVDGAAGKQDGPTGGQVVEELVGTEAEFVKLHPWGAVDQGVVTGKDSRYFRFWDLLLEGDVGEVELPGNAFKTLAIRATSLENNFDRLRALLQDPGRLENKF